MKKILLALLLISSSQLFAQDGIKYKTGSKSNSTIKKSDPKNFELLEQIKTNKIVNKKYDTIDLDFNHINAFNQVLIGGTDDNLFIDVDEEKQKLNFSFGQTKVEPIRLIGTITGSVSSIDEPLFDNGWTPRNWNVSPNLNFYFKPRRYYYDIVLNDSCKKRTDCENKPEYLPIENSYVVHRLTTFDYIFWLNITPEYARNSYRQLTPPSGVDSIKLKKINIEGLNFIASINYYARWQNLKDWRHLRGVHWYTSKYRPTFFYASLGFENKILTNKDQFDVVEVEVEKNFVDAAANETRRRKDVFNAYEGILEYKRVNRAFAQVTIGLSNTLQFDVKYIRSFGNSSFDNNELKFTLAGKFANSEGEVKTITGVYLKFINSGGPIFGITTKLPF